MQAGSRWVQDGPCILGAHDRGGWWSHSSIFWCQCSKLTPLRVARANRSPHDQGLHVELQRATHSHHAIDRPGYIAALACPPPSTVIRFILTLQFITVMVFQNSTWILNSDSLAVETGFLFTHARTHARTDNSPRFSGLVHIRIDLDSEQRLLRHCCPTHRYGKLSLDLSWC